MACLVCSSPNEIIFVEKPKDREYFETLEKESVLYRCVDCESIYQYPQPNKSDLAKCYGNDYQNYVKTSVPLLSEINQVVQKIMAKRFAKKFPKDLRILDYGCGQGAFLRALSDERFLDLWGYDPVRYEETCNRKNINFIYDLDELKRLFSSFDVIRLHHVIEHATKGEELIKTVGSLLRPGGIIIGQTPNASHYTSYLMQSYWGPLHYPYHTIIFSASGFTGAVKKYGLQPNATSGTLIPTAWALTLENFIKENLYIRSRGRTFFYSFLMIALLPLALFDWIVAPHATANFNFEIHKPKD